MRGDLTWHVSSFAVSVDVPRVAGVGGVDARVDFGLRDLHVVFVDV